MAPPHLAPSLLLSPALPKERCHVLHLSHNQICWLRQKTEAESKSESESQMPPRAWQRNRIIDFHLLRWIPVIRSLAPFSVFCVGCCVCPDTCKQTDSADRRQKEQEKRKKLVLSCVCLACVCVCVSLGIHKLNLTPEGICTSSSVDDAVSRRRR